MNKDGFEESWPEFKVKWMSPPYNLSEADAKATWAEIVARRAAGNPKVPVYGAGAGGAAAALKDFDDKKLEEGKFVFEARETGLSARRKQNIPKSTDAPKHSTPPHKHPKDSKE